MTAGIRRPAEEIALGPPPLTADQWRHGRYVPTCYLDDLLDTSPTSRHERLAVAEPVPREAGDAVSLRWTGSRTPRARPGGQ